MERLAHLIGHTVSAFGREYTLVALEMIDGEAFAALTDDGSHKIYCRVAWVFVW